MGVRDLFFSIGASDKTGAAFSGVKSNLRSVDGMVATTTQKMNRLGQSMMGFGVGLTAITTPILYAFRDSLPLYDQQARAEAKVRQAVLQTGQAAGFAATQLFQEASALQNLTRYGDEAILDGVTGQLLTFTNIAGEQFKRAQWAAMDLSTVLNSDLKSSSIMLGKALNDPVKGLTAMSRAGVAFTEDQAKVIKALAETGNLAAAQTIILDELEKQYGGQAKAAAEAGTGALAQISNSWGDLKEVVGGVINDLLPPISNFFGFMINGFLSLPEPMQRFAVAMGLITLAAGPLAVAGGVVALAWSPVTLTILAVGAAIGVAIGLVAAFWPELKKLSIQAGIVFEEIKLTIADLLEVSTERAVLFANNVISTFEGTWQAIKALWSGLPDIVGEIMNGAANAYITGLEGMLNTAGTMINEWLGLMNSALDFMGVERKIPLVPELKLGRLENQFAGALADTGEKASEAWNKAWERNAFEVPDLGLDSWRESAENSIASLKDQLNEIPNEPMGSFLPDVKDLTQVLPDATSAVGSFSGGMKQLKLDSKEASETVQETKTIFDGFGRETSDMLKDVFSDGKVTLDDFSDFVLSWGDKLLNRFLDGVFDPLGDAMQGMFSSMTSGTSVLGGTSGGGLSSIFSSVGNIFSSLIGMDTGGEMAVGGRSGIDRNVAAFRVSSGESIKVVKRGNSGFERPIVVNIQTPDPTSFKQSRGQVAATLRRAALSGSRNS